MKKYFSNLITILISCTLIACTVFFSVYDGFENRVMPIEEEITPKISADDTTTGVNMNLINTKDIFGSKINQNNGSNPASSASDPANSHSAPTYPTRKSVTSRKTTSATTASTEKAGTQTTKPVKVPEDESKNETYIKDPDYKSKYYIVVYTGSQSVVVYGKDESGAYNVIVKAFTVSTGKSSTPTRKGMYKIRAKYRWRMLMGPCWGQWCSSISSIMPPTTSSVGLRHTDASECASEMSNGFTTIVLSAPRFTSYGSQVPREQAFPNARPVPNTAAGIPLTNGRKAIPTSKMLKKPR